MQLRKFIKTHGLLILILLSLLLHILWYYSVFNINFRKKFVAPIQVFFDSEKKQNHQELLAALQALKKNKGNAHLPAQLRAPHSNFGWVLFDKPHQTKKTITQTQTVEIPTTMDGDVGESPQIQASEEETDTKPEKKSETIPEEIVPKQQQHDESNNTQNQKETLANEPKEKPKEQPAKPTETAGKASITIDESAKQSDNQPIESPQKQAPTATITNSAQITPSVEDRINQIKELQEKLNAFQSGRMPKRKHLTTLNSTPQKQTVDRFIGGPDGIRIRGARSEQPQPKRNIIALTKGYVEKLIGEEGTDLVDRDGDPTKTPSLEEQRELTYEMKINWCIQATWKQNFCKKAAITPLDGEAIIEFSIDEHGNLTNCSLLQSSGKPHLDATIMKLISQSSPFPPMPKLFHKKIHTTGRIVRVYTDRFNFQF